MSREQSERLEREKKQRDFEAMMRAGAAEAGRHCTRETIRVPDGRGGWINVVRCRYDKGTPMVRA